MYQVGTFLSVTVSFHTENLSKTITVISKNTDPDTRSGTAQCGFTDPQLVVAPINRVEIHIRGTRQDFQRHLERERGIISMIHIRGTRQDLQRHLEGTKRERTY